MVKNMMPYYLSRLGLSLVIGIFMFAIGSSIWISILLSAMILAFFILAPHSGRYSVHPEFGITALRRDERNELINDKAARNAFVVCMLVVAAIAIYFGSQGTIIIPVIVLKAILAIGVVTYYGTDLLMRRS